MRPLGGSDSPNGVQSSPNFAKSSGRCRQFRDSAYEKAKTKEMTKDEIYKKTENIEELGGMTVNERLFVTGLMNTFDKAKEKDKKLARLILEAIRVDKESINIILE